MNNSVQHKRAFLLTCILLFLCLTSCAYLFLHRTASTEGYTAYIYTNGDIYQTITLSDVPAPYSLTIHSSDGGYNTIRIESDGIRIIGADCPDQICVKQGQIHNDLLPITCLPHGLVIELKRNKPDSDSPDILTH